MCVCVQRATTEAAGVKKNSQLTDCDVTRVCISLGTHNEGSGKDVCRSLYLRYSRPCTQLTVRAEHAHRRCCSAEPVMHINNSRGLLEGHTPLERQPEVDLSWSLLCALFREVHALALEILESPALSTSLLCSTSLMSQVRLGAKVEAASLA